MGKIVRNVYILGIVFAVVAGLNAYVGLLQVTAPVQREFERKLEAELDFVIGEISAAFTLAGQTLRTAANYVALESDQEKVARFVAELQGQSAAYLSVYRGLPAWHYDPLQQGQIVYAAPGSGERVITASTPVHGPDGEFTSVVSIDLSLDDLLAALQVEDADPERKVFILTHQSSLFGELGPEDFA